MATAAAAVESLADVAVAELAAAMAAVADWGNGSEGLRSTFLWSHRNYSARSLSNT